MSFFREIAGKPWLVGSPGLDLNVRLSATKMGLRLFLGVVSVIFFLLIVSYGGRMALEGAAPPPDIKLLWPNTIALVLSSMALHWALVAARRNRIETTQTGLILAGVLALLFVAGQLVAWWLLQDTSFFKMASPAIAFFYLLTGIHGLHILGGLTALGRVIYRVFLGESAARLVAGIEVCTTYFHFMLGVWLLLFFLVFTGDNMDLLLTLCGLK